LADAANEDIQSEAVESPPDVETDQAPPEVAWWHLHRRLYDWVLHWAETPYGGWALFLISFAESSFFPVPPDVLLAPLTLGARRKWWKFALSCSVASVLGAVLGYLIGAFLWLGVSGEFTPVATFFFDHVPGFSEEVYHKMGEKYEQYNFWIVFTAGFTPIPFKVITITAGVFKVNFLIFLIASAVSRSARFFLVSVLFYKFGPTVKPFIDKYFNWLCLLFMVLLIGGFVVLKMVSGH